MLHRQIRQMDPELAGRTVFMSGLLQSEANLGYYMSSSGGFIAKPFDIRQVLRAIRNLLPDPDPVPLVGDTVSHDPLPEAAQLPPEHPGGATPVTVTTCDPAR